MKIKIMAVAAAALFIVANSSADARPRHHHQTSAKTDIITCDQRGCSDTKKLPTDANGNRAEKRQKRQEHAAVRGERTSRPWRFCGWEAARYKGIADPFGVLNLAANWGVYFKPASPAPGMAAWRNGHVMVLMHHVGGDDWMVHDGNSGGHQTHEHVRSIRGYGLVDPGRQRHALVYLPKNKKNRHYASSAGRTQ